MKRRRITRFIIGILCMLLVGSMATVQAQEQVSWNVGDLNYSLSRQWNGSEFYNRTSVDIVQDDTMGYLHINGGHLQDELFVFSVGLYGTETNQWGSGEPIWSKNYETLQVNIAFSQIREWNLEPGDYLISVAAKSWGEDASLDMYDLYVSEKNHTGESNGGTGDIVIPDGDKPVVDEKPGMNDSEVEAVTKPGKVFIKTVKRTSSKKAKITWKKVKGSGIKYEVKYATSKKFKKKNTVIKNVKKTSITLSKLNKNKKYYIKIRAYKVVKGNKVYGSYSAIKTIKKK